VAHFLKPEPLAKPYGFKPFTFDHVPWKDLERCPDHTIYQTREWLTFVWRTQHALPLVAAVNAGNRTIGFFVGSITQKIGMRILGSPFPGWSTDYMGFALLPGACRKSAIRGLFQFAFGELNCAHVELMDRRLAMAEVLDLDVQYNAFQSYVVDLTQDENTLFTNLYSDCRRCVRNAQKNGVTIEVANPIGFAEDYYEQLKDVFAKQNLIPTYNLERVRELIAHLHPTGKLFLLRARDQGGRSIATGIFPYMNGVMSFWGGASWRKYQILRPNQALQWFAMKHAKGLGLHTYDMGGDGEYKKQYGGQQIIVPWIRKSKYFWLEPVRNAAQHAYRMRQLLLGHMRRKQTTRRCFPAPPQSVDIR
jgi:hypothetical protein